MKTSNIFIAASVLMSVFSSFYWLVVGEFGATANAAILFALWAIIQVIREHTEEVRKQGEWEREMQWKIATLDKKGE